jgi:WD40 repeat protein
MQEEAIAALPGQRVLAPEGYNAARLLVWDLDAGRAVGELLGHVGGVSTLAVSADGRRALSAGQGSGVLSDCPVHPWVIPRVLRDRAGSRA